MDRVVVAAYSRVIVVIVPKKPGGRMLMLLRLISLRNGAKFGTLRLEHTHRLAKVNNCNIQLGQSCHVVEDTRRQSGDLVAADISG